MTVAYDRYGLPNSCGNDITDQAPYGEFAPGRWAWMLDDIKPTTERCPWCGGDGHDPEGEMGEMCEVCSHAGTKYEDRGRCAPIPAKGRQKVWGWTP